MGVGENHGAVDYLEACLLRGTPWLQYVDPGSSQ